MTLHKNFDRVGIQPHRSYYIPFGVNDEVKTKYGIVDRTSSSRFLSLDGIWQIRQHDNVEDFVLNESLEQTIPVPSCVQLHGYDQIQYLNARYPFPVMLPHLPYENPCWHYRRTFNLKKKKGERYYINFEGVDSAFYLFINGKYKGYSQISHATSEFDITDFVVNGKNSLDVVVLKWCASSYLECQDMFRENGIFRDVLLFEYENTYLYDFSVYTVKNGDKYDLTVDFDMNGDLNGASISAELYDGKKLLAKETADAREKSKITFSNLDVTEWNAEEPYTYDLLITFVDGNGKKTYVKNITGFKTIEIKGNVFYFNGKPIKFKGVNHHDTNMHNGYVLTGEEIKAELELMKKFKINSIRTSHYPPDPTLLTLADIMGFYIIDEADIETHGAGDIKTPYDNCIISHDLKLSLIHISEPTRPY